MEEQRIITKSKFGKRLLILFLIFSTLPLCNFFGDTRRLTSAMVRDLSVVPVENQKLYINTDIKFELKIPYVSPGNVQINSQDYPADIEFKTLRKTEYNSDEGGTKIEIWLSFAKTGTYNIKPLSLVIQGSKRSIKFAPVVISDNPKNIAPKLVLEFSNGKQVGSESKSGTVLFTTEAGKKLSFTVYLQHAVQMLQFNWEIPKNSIFTKVKDFEIKEVKYRENTYSEKLIPVASFDWTILAEGKNVLPVIRISVIAYNGTRSELRIPVTYVETVKSDVSNVTGSKVYDDIFDQAFTAGEEIQSQNENNLTWQDCEKLAELRSKEKNRSLFSKKQKEERIAFEDSLNLSGTADEYPSILVLISSLLVVFLLILIVIFIKKRNSLMLIIFVPIAVIVLVFQVTCYVRSSKDFGICKGCTVYSIPEKTADSRQEINIGSRVQILEKAGDWTYIQFGEVGGWCESSSICFIK